LTWRSPTSWRITVTTLSSDRGGVPTVPRKLTHRRSGRVVLCQIDWERTAVTAPARNEGHYGSTV
jgi:hypothetical protein